MIDRATYIKRKKLIQKKVTTKKIEDYRIDGLDDPEVYKYNISFGIPLKIPFIKDGVDTGDMFIGVKSTSMEVTKRELIERLKLIGKINFIWNHGTEIYIFNENKDIFLRSYINCNGLSIEF